VFFKQDKKRKIKNIKAKKKKKRSIIIIILHLYIN
jgi:NADH:ubiquinone oxidoreductase subunit E